MRAAIASRLALVAAILAAAGCEQLPRIEIKPPAASTPAAAAQPSEDQRRERARDMLGAGVRQYDTGDYDNAVKSLTGSLEGGLLPKAEQIRAHKYLAFSHCVGGRDAQCRSEFRKLFEINSDFALTQAEDGHPSWGPVYRDVRTQLITEREAAQRKPVTLLPLGKAEQMLADGVVKYDIGDYPAALKLLEGALGQGLKDRNDQVRAMKHVAFALCLQDKFAACRAAFIKIYEVDPNFNLTPAEAGHPSWTKTFAAARAQAKKEIAERDAKERTAKDRGAAPPSAAVPKK